MPTGLASGVYVQAVFGTTGYQSLLQFGVLYARLRER